MTLLQLLREHLKEWPEDVRAISQDSDGEVNANFFSKPLPLEKPVVFRDGSFVWTSCEWEYMGNPDQPYYMWELPLADDASTAIVTREMWEAKP